MRPPQQNVLRCLCSIQKHFKFYSNFPICSTPSRNADVCCATTTHVRLNQCKDSSSFQPAWYRNFPMKAEWIDLCLRVVCIQKSNTSTPRRQDFQFLTLQDRNIETKMQNWYWKYDIYMKIDKFLKFLLWVPSYGYNIWHESLIIGSSWLVWSKHIDKGKKKKKKHNKKTKLNTRSLFLFSERVKQIRKASYPRYWRRTKNSWFYTQKTFCMNSFSFWTTVDNLCFKKNKKSEVELGQDAIKLTQMNKPTP